MADVRALLKAKRQEAQAQARITHPYAAYGANGALRCAACGVAVKFAGAWEGHLGSKAHRVAVANLKASAALSKRKAEEQEGGEDADADQDQDEDEQMEMERPGKRQRTEEREVQVRGAGGVAGADSVEEEEEAPRQHGAASSRAGFPMDFFSDPARAPLARGGRDGGDDEDDDDEEMMDQDEVRQGTTTTTAPAPKSQFEMEWAAFERDMQTVRLPQPATAAAAAAATATDPQEAYARATIAAEPELVPSLVGLPTSKSAGAGAGAGAGTQDDGREGQKAAAVSEEEVRRRKELDERELIIDRLVEEERAQEDAYNRVALLRNRVQMLKKKRELAKAKGDKAAADTQA
jgi:zinc finger protein 830